ncbi:MAG: hypothetical protein NVSMB24_31990 [Mucilaginibacter sp.]
MGKLNKTLIGLFLIVAIGAGLICFIHPIMFKWLFGSARVIGKPIGAIVYTDGHINNNIKVYRNGEKDNDYLISLKEFDKPGMLKFINLDLAEKWIGRPVGTNKDCYDVINGILFQSDAGARFVDFKDDMKGYSFEPHLAFTSREIKFNIPPNQLKFDSIRIELTKTD